MRGSIIISLDCEGKWGVADRPKSRRDCISNARLIDAYTRILNCFEKHQFKASFAFVSALCLDKDELLGMLSGVDLRHSGGNWLTNPIAEIGSGAADGWCVPELMGMVMSRGVHHICTHGGTHLPYSNQLTPREAVVWDINFAKKFHERSGLPWGGLVFPRNIVGHLDSIAESGITFYRSMDRPEEIEGRFGKAIRLANEFVSADRFGLWEVGRAQRGVLSALSPGKFLNARVGFRRRVPASVTVRRVESMMEYAVSHGRIIHIYTHPHNFIDDVGMHEKLDIILGKANELVRRGKLVVMTMEGESNAGN